MFSLHLSLLHTGEDGEEIVYTTNIKQERMSTDTSESDSVLTVKKIKKCVIQLWKEGRKEGRSFSGVT